MSASGEVRFTVRIPSDVARRVEAFGGASCISRNQAIVELLKLGLDADTAGVETALQVQAQVKRELQSIRGLIVAAVDAGDMAVAASLAHQVNAGLIKSDQIRTQYTAIRKALPAFKQMKKQVSVGGDASPAGSRADAVKNLLDGTIEG